MAISRLPMFRVVRARGAAAVGVVADFRRPYLDRRALGAALQRAGAILKNATSTEDLVIEVETETKHTNE